jgi:hypothetical protein
MDPVTIGLIAAGLTAYGGYDLLKEYLFEDPVRQKQFNLQEQALQRQQEMQDMMFRRQADVSQKLIEERRQQRDAQEQANLFRMAIEANNAPPMPAGFGSMQLPQSQPLRPPSLAGGLGL